MTEIGGPAFARGFHLRQGYDATRRRAREIGDEGSAVGSAAARPQDHGQQEDQTTGSGS